MLKGVSKTQNAFRVAALCLIRGTRYGINCAAKSGNHLKRNVFICDGHRAIKPQVKQDAC